MIYSEETLSFKKFIVFLIFLVSKANGLDFASKPDWKINYRPNLSLGAAWYFHQPQNYAGAYHIWSPLWYDQQGHLVFTDLRIFDRSGSSFEGNVHVGFRQLFSGQEKMWGLYGAFDQRRSNFSNNFRQLTLGGELWLGNWFLGGNYYRPIGRTEHKITQHTDQITWEKGQCFDHYQLMEGKAYWEEKQIVEIAQTGGDFELGYAWNRNWISYLGGYYFGGNGSQDLRGGRLRLVYQYIPNSGVIERINLESGVQYDNRRGCTGYFGIKIRFGVNNNSIKQGFNRHMEDLVRRDPDIMLDTKFNQKEEELPGKWLGGRLIDDSGKILDREELWSQALNDFGVEANLPPEALTQALHQRRREYQKKYYTRAKEHQISFIYYEELYNLIEVLRKLRYPEALSYPTSVEKIKSPKGESDSTETQPTLDNLEAIGKLNQSLEKGELPVNRWQLLQQREVRLGSQGKIKREGCSFSLISNCHYNYALEIEGVYPGLVPVSYGERSGGTPCWLNTDYVFRLIGEDLSNYSLLVCKFGVGKSPETIVLGQVSIDFAQIKEKNWEDLLFKLSGLTVFTNRDETCGYLTLRASNPHYGVVVQHKQGEVYRNLWGIDFSLRRAGDLELWRGMTAVERYWVEEDLSKTPLGTFRERVSSGKVNDRFYHSYPLLDRFVDQHRDPLKLINFVHNQIDLDRTQLVSDTLKTVEATFLDRKGSMEEQCTLLVYLLRKAGESVFMVQSSQEFKIEKNNKETLLGLNTSLLPDYYYYSKLKSSHFLIPKLVWVKYYHPEKKSWVDIFPWIKEAGWSLGESYKSFVSESYHDNLYWGKAYLKGDFGLGSPYDLWLEQFSSKAKERGVPLEIIGLVREKGNLLYPSFESLPTLTYDSSRVEVVRSISLLEIESTLSLKFRGISARDGKTTDLLQTPSISARAWAERGGYLYFVPRSEKEDCIDHWMVVRMKGIKGWDKQTAQFVEPYLRTQEKEVLLPTDVQQIEIEYLLRDSSYKEVTRKIFSIRRGVVCSLGLNFSPVSTQRIEEAIASYEALRKIQTARDMDVLDEHPHIDTDVLGERLHLVGLYYFHKINRESENLLTFSQIREENIQLGLSKISPDFSAGSGQIDEHGHLRGEAKLFYPQVDMVDISLNNSGSEDKISEELKLDILFGSYNEHAVINELYPNQKAISTVKLLELAHQAWKKNHYQTGEVGFLEVDQERFKAIEADPQKAKDTYFSHLEVNLLEAKKELGSQWETLAKVFRGKNGERARAFLTPGAVSSENSKDYRGCGSLIFNGLKCMALISGNKHYLNGGYGSRLENNFKDAPSGVDLEFKKALSSQVKYPTLSQALGKYSDTHESIPFPGRSIEENLEHWLTTQEASSFFSQASKTVAESTLSSQTTVTKDGETKVNLEKNVQDNPWTEIWSKAKQVEQKSPLKEVDFFTPPKGEQGEVAKVLPDFYSNSAIPLWEPKTKLPHSFLGDEPEAGEDKTKDFREIYKPIFSGSVAWRQPMQEQKWEEKHYNGEGDSSEVDTTSWEKKDNAKEVNIIDGAEKNIEPRGTSNQPTKEEDFQENDPYSSIAQKEHKGVWDTLADPVDLVSGAYLDLVTDLRVREKGINFTRSYHSQALEKGNLGYGWRANFLAKLKIIKNNRQGEPWLLQTIEEDGTTVTYRKMGKSWRVFPEDNLHLYGEEKVWQNSLIQQGEEYFLKTTNGTKWRYKQSGKELNLVEWETLEGVKYQVKYEDGLLSELNGGDSWLKFSYQGDWLKSIEDDWFRQVNFTVDPWGDLIKVEYWDGSWVEYGYQHYWLEGKEESSHLLISKREPLGKELINFYNLGGQVLKQWVAEEVGKLRLDAQFEYVVDQDDPSWSIRKVTDPLGNHTEYHLYDGLIYKIVDPIGGSYFQSWYLDKTATGYQYLDGIVGKILLEEGFNGAYHQLKGSVDWRGLSTSYRYDGLGRKIEQKEVGEDLSGDGEIKERSTTWEYGENHLILERYRSGSIELVKQYTYQGDQLVSLLSSENSITYFQENFTYTESKLIHWEGFKPGEEEGKRIKNWVYGSQHELIEEEVIGLNPISEKLESFKTVYQYDPLGYIAKKIDSNGTGWEYLRNDRGQIVKETVWSAKGEKLSTKRYIYDILGRLVKTVERRPNWLNAKLTSWVYDPLDHLLSQVIYGEFFKIDNYEYKEELNLLNQARITTYRYDPLGQVVEKGEPDGTVWNYSYNAVGLLERSSHWDTEHKVILEEIQQKFNLSRDLIEIDQDWEKIYRSYTTQGLLSKEGEKRLVYDGLERLVNYEAEGEVKLLSYEVATNTVVIGNDQGELRLQKQDSWGNQVLTYQNGKWNSYWYDALNRVVGEKLAATREEAEQKGYTPGALWKSYLYRSLEGLNQQLITSDSETIYRVLSSDGLGNKRGEWWENEKGDKIRIIKEAGDLESGAEEGQLENIYGQIWNINHQVGHEFYRYDQAGREIIHGFTEHKDKILYQKNRVYNSLGLLSQIKVQDRVVEERFYQGAVLVESKFTPPLVWKRKWNEICQMEEITSNYGEEILLGYRQEENYYEDFNGYFRETLVEDTKGKEISIGQEDREIGRLSINWAQGYPISYSQQDFIGKLRTDIIQNYDYKGSLLKQAVKLNQENHQIWQQSWLNNYRASLDLVGSNYHLELAYNPFGQISELKLDDYTWKYSYNLEGKLAEKSYLNGGLIDRYRYLRPIEAVNRVIASKNTTVADSVYKLDLLGRKTENDASLWESWGETNEVINPKIESEYDSEGRLTKLINQPYYVATYAYQGKLRTYSRVENSQTGWCRTHEVLKRTARLWEEKITQGEGDKQTIYLLTSQYDQMGQLINKLYRTLEGKEVKRQNLTWDSEGRLIKVEDWVEQENIATWEGYYDALGRLLKSKRGEIVQDYYYDPMGGHHLLAVKINKEGKEEFFKLVPKINLQGEVDYLNGPEGVIIGDQTFVYDHQVARDTLISKDLSFRTEGKEIYGWLDKAVNLGEAIGLSDPSEILLKCFYAGHLREGMGLINFGARYYDPETGRFISPDPLGYEGSRDLYSYAEGDPLNYSDYQGYFASKVYEEGETKFFDLLPKVGDKTYSAYKAEASEEELAYLRHSLMLKGIDVPVRKVKSALESGWVQGLGALAGGAAVYAGGVAIAVPLGVTVGAFAALNGIADLVMDRYFTAEHYAELGERYVNLPEEAFKVRRAAGEDLAYAASLWGAGKIGSKIKVTPGEVNLVKAKLKSLKLNQLFEVSGGKQGGGHNVVSDLKVFGSEVGESPSIRRKLVTPTTEKALKDLPRLEELLGEHNRLTRRVLERHYRGLDYESIEGVTLQHKKLNLVNRELNKYYKEPYEALLKENKGDIALTDRQWGEKIKHSGVRQHLKVLEEIASEAKGEIHHVVHKSLEERLLKLDPELFDLNDPRNLICLPTEEKVALEMGMAKHKGRHTNLANKEIIKSIQDRVKLNQRPSEAIREVMKNQEKGLLEGKIDLYKKE